jgi:protein-S-isoprenylcysteine O-methyltransferase Ste14
MSTQIQTQKKSVKRTFWAVAIFYALIAFEFFYMASPFAVYFYSVYQPSLNFLNQYPGAAWLVSFFLPHIVIETSSTLVNLHNVVGAVLAAIGFLAFCVGAGQVYYHKLARKGAVTGGVYNVIRHPQYAAFALCSLGLLMLWPRYIVLVMFITMLFAYYFLAKIEERECEEKFGQSYMDYKNKTHMFLPFKIPLVDKLSGLPQSIVGKILIVAALYVMAILAAVGLARGLQSAALNSLYGVYTPNSATIAVNATSPDTLAEITAIALSNSQVQARLAEIPDDAKLINYVLPTEWYVGEIPMTGGGGHNFPADYDENLYKIIFTQANLPIGRAVEGKAILQNTVVRTPIAEVWVNLAQGSVVDVKIPTVTANYENVPVPVY